MLFRRVSAVYCCRMVLSGILNNLKEFSSDDVKLFSRGSILVSCVVDWRCTPGTHGYITYMGSIRVVMMFFPFLHLILWCYVQLYSLCFCKPLPPLSLKKERIWGGRKAVLVLLTYKAFVVQIFRKEPFFYGHDNYDQLVKIAKVIYFWNLNQKPCTFFGFLLK